MLNRLLHGFLFGIGFAIALGIVWTAYTMLVVPTIVTTEFEGFYSESINGDPAEVVPAEVGAVAKQREFDLYKGPRARIEIPPGGGLLSIAITDTPDGGDRPSTIQAWITKDEAFLIETTGESPTVKKVSYPESNPVVFASELVREYAGFRENNMTTTVEAADVRALRKGAPSTHNHLNGVLRITTDGVVFFVPNKFET